MGGEPITQSALSWLRETETLDLLTLKRAYWEALEVEAIDVGLVYVRNESYTDPTEHTHEVSIEPTASIVCHCTCPQYTYRGKVCKHMVATALALDTGDLSPQSVGCKRRAPA